MVVKVYASHGIDDNDTGRHALLLIMVQQDGFFFTEPPDSGLSHCTRDRHSSFQ